MGNLRSLYEEQQRLMSDMSEMKTRLGEVNRMIQEATSERLGGLFSALGKQFGTVRALTEEGIEIKGEIPKKVEWDSGVLMGVANSMPWDVVSKVFDIKLSIPEKSYDKLADIGLTDDVIAAINEARTVKYGDLKISLEVK